MYYFHLNMKDSSQGRQLDDCPGKNTHNRYRECPVPGQCAGVYQEWVEGNIACTDYQFIYFEPCEMSGVLGALVPLPVDLEQKQG